MKLPPPPPDIRLGKRALHDLLASCHLYCSERQDIQPYAKERVSWPDVGAAPIEVLPLLPDEDRLRLADWRHRLLLDPADRARPLLEDDVPRPYMDPVLRSQPRVYNQFLVEMFRRGLIVFEHTDDMDFTVGCFCVVKKSGALRLVFDTAGQRGIRRPPGDRFAICSCLRGRRGAQQLWGGRLLHGHCRHL